MEDEYESFYFGGSLPYGFDGFRGAPASDRVEDAFDEAARIHAGGGKGSALCNLIDKYVDASTIAVRLLGNYAQSSDTAGVSAFRNQADSLMATKVMPQLKKYAGEKGTYVVNQTASARGTGFAVGVRVQAKGKNYNATVILNAAMKISDVEYLGFSGVNYAGRDLRKELDTLRSKTATPVSQYVKDMKAKPEFVNCN